METWMPAGALSPIFTHILLHHYCSALGGSQDNGFVVWVCRCGDCLWGHMFCQWTQGLKRFCTQGHRGRVCSPRYSHHVLYLHLQQCLALLFCQWTQGLRGVAPEATEEEFVVIDTHIVYYICFCSSVWVYLSWTTVKCDCVNCRCISNRMSQVFCCWESKQQTIMWNRKALFYRKHDTTLCKQGNNLLLKLFVMIITMPSLQEICPTPTIANGKGRCK